jgi:NDP-sugar pyrophosphorylase family protein
LRLAWAAAGSADGEALVVNGDSFFDVPLADLVAAHRATDADVTIALHRATDAGRFGSVELAGDRVIAFREKAAAGPALINGGIYVVRPSVVDRLPTGAPASLERDLFPALIEDPTAIVIGRSFPGFFTDIGVPADYGRIRANLPPEMARYTGASS